MNESGSDKQLSVQLSKELLKPSVDLSADFGELLLDSFLADNSLLERIPVLKTLVNCVKAGAAVRDLFTAQKLAMFLRDFHTTSIPAEALHRFREDFGKDPKYQARVVNQILIFVDRSNTLLKARVIAHLFGAHIAGHLTWERLTTLLCAVDTVHPDGLRPLHDFATADPPDLSMLKGESTGFLLGSGFVVQEMIVGFGGGGTFPRVSQLGRDLVNYGLVPLFQPQKE